MADDKVRPSEPYPRGRFWDNLIPLKTGLFGTQTAGWTPGAPVTSGLGCRILTDQMIPVDTHVSLASDVFIPKKAGRYPAVVAFSAYSKELHTSGAPTGTNEVGSPPVFTDRGYAYVIVERRGMGISGGETTVFFGDRDVSDHEKVIAWAAAQPWCNGDIVLFGTSYYGCVQAMVAARQPPALKAYFCNEICTDYFRQIVQFGGSPNVYFFGVWMGANFNKTVMHLRVPPIVRALASRFLNSWLKRLWWPRLKRRLPRIMQSFMRATPVREVREMWVNWMLDGKTRETCTMPLGPYADLERIAVPFVTVQNLGMFNLHQYGSYELFHGTATPKNRKWLILAEPAYELPVFAWQLEALAFFDHIVHGVDNGYAAQAPVRYWLDGADLYVGAEDFPIPAARTQRLYLASRGDDSSIHSLEPEAPSEGSNRWAAIPLGAPVPGGLSEVLNQTVIYELPIDRKTDFVGPVTANLTFSSNEIDSYVLARLGRIDLAGVDHLLSLGAITPSRRTIDNARGTAVEIALDVGARQPLVPGKPVILRFSLTPGPTQLMPGEKLRLTIASRTDLVESDMAHDHAHFHMQVPPYFSRNTLHYGPNTYIEIQQIS